MDIHGFAGKCKAGFATKELHGHIPDIPGYQHFYIRVWIYFCKPGYHPKSNKTRTPSITLILVQGDPDTIPN